MQVGFTTLRGLVIQRPSLRMDALHVLFELTTHPGDSNSSFYPGLYSEHLCQ